MCMVRGVTPLSFYLFTSTTPFIHADELNGEILYKFQQKIKQYGVWYRKIIYNLKYNLNKNQVIKHDVNYN